MGTDVMVSTVVIVISGVDRHAGVHVATGEWRKTGCNRTTHFYVASGDDAMPGDDRTAHFRVAAHHGRAPGNCAMSYVGSATGVDGPGPEFMVEGHMKTL